MPRQPIRVHIFNQSYTLLADEDDPGAVEEIAQQIDELMTSIASRPGSGDSTGVAVLACLHLADKLRAAEKKLKSFEKKLKSFEDKSERIASMLEDALQ